MHRPRFTTLFYNLSTIKHIFAVSRTKNSFQLKPVPGIELATKLKLLAKHVLRTDKFPNVKLIKCSNHLQTNGFLTVWVRNANISTLLLSKVQNCNKQFPRM